LGASEGRWNCSSGCPRPFSDARPCQSPPTIGRSQRNYAYSGKENSDPPLLRLVTPVAVPSNGKPSQGGTHRHFTVFGLRNDPTVYQSARLRNGLQVHLLVRSLQGSKPEQTSIPKMFRFCVGCFSACWGWPNCRVLPESLEGEIASIDPIAIVPQCGSFANGTAHSHAARRQSHFAVVKPVAE
jgi:hypothetical protein